eukprot:Awhi_evm1s10630
MKFFESVLIAGVLSTATSESVCKLSNDRCCFEDAGFSVSEGKRVLPVNFLRDCFNSLEFNDRASQARHTNVIAVKHGLNSFYSYKDLVHNSTNSDANPTNYDVFEISVDLDAELDKLLEKNYTNAIDFHFDIGKIMGDLRDAHTNYIGPLTVNGLAYVNTVQYESFLSEQGQQKFILRGPTILFDEMTAQDAYSLVYGKPYPITKEYLGAEIAKVNGIGALDFFSRLSYDRCVYKDRGACMNQFLKTEGGLFDKGLPKMGKMNNDSSFFPQILDIEFVNGKTIEVESVFGIARDAIADGNTTTLLDKIYGSDAKLKRINHKFKDLQKLLTTKPSANRDNRKTELLTTSFQATDDVEEELPLQMCDFGDKKFCFHVMDDKNAIVITLPSFTINPASVFKLFNMASKVSYEHNIDKLIIDVSGNGGGKIKTAHHLLRWLIEGWNTKESLEACEDVDFRASQYFEDFATIYVSRPINFHRKLATMDFEALSFLVDVCSSYVDYDEELAESFCKFLRGKSHKILRKLSEKMNDMYSSFASPHTLDIFNGTHTTLHQRGGVQSGYSPIHNEECIDSVSKTFFQNTKKENFYWSDIRLVSDGTCGSACALFSTKLWLHEKARIFTYGGLAQDNVMNFAAFHGGNVEEDDEFWRKVVFTTVSGALLSNNYTMVEHLHTMNLDTAGMYRFNFHEGYHIGLRSMGDNPLPREFYKIGGDVHLNNIWPSRDKEEMEKLYQTVAHYSVCNNSVSFACWYQVGGLSFLCMLIVVNIICFGFKGYKYLQRRREESEYERIK